MNAPRYLGNQSAPVQTPEEFELDCVPNTHVGCIGYVARLTVPEFTSLCPVTGQPDFAHVVIDYVPDTLLIESKALKLYMVSFRNHGAFHEQCTNMIAAKLMVATLPRWLRVCAFWYPRGGIPIDVFWQSGDPPDGVYVPEPGISPYKGRV